MIETMITGRVFGKFTQRISKNGNPFITGNILAYDYMREKVMISAISFDIDCINKLSELEPNSQVCIVGQMKLRIYTDNNGNPRNGVDVLIHQVMSIYQIQSKKKKFTKSEEPSTTHPTPTVKDIEKSKLPIIDDLDNDIPFDN